MKPCQVASFVGIPYVPGGVPPQGADCWTLVRSFAKEVLHQDWPEQMYDLNNWQVEGNALIVQEMNLVETIGSRWQKLPQPEPRCLIIMRMMRDFHCGLALDGWLMLHTLKGRESVIEPIIRWRQSIIACYRWTEAHA